MDRRDFLFDWLHRQPQPERPTATTGQNIRIAETVFGIHTSHAPLAEEIRRYFGDYLTQAAPDSTLFVEPLALENRHGLWEDDDAEFVCRQDSVVQRDFAARRFPSGVVARINGEEISDSLLNLLRWAVAEQAPTKGCLLVHAASIVSAERGYVFFGHSGAGKSTTAGLIAESDPGATVLGDDAAILKVNGSDLFLLSAPLGSAYTKEAPPSREVPLAGLFSLEQSSELSLAPLTDSEALSALLASTMMTRFDDFSDERIRLARRLSEGTVHRLRFRKDPSFWPMVLAATRKPSSRPNAPREGRPHV